MLRRRGQFYAIVSFEKTNAFKLGNDNAARALRFIVKCYAFNDFGGYTSGLNRKRNLWEIKPLKEYETELYIYGIR